MASKNNIQEVTVQDNVQTTMMEVFNRASAGNIAGVENIEKKDGTIVPKKEYHFVNAIGKRTTMTTYDRDVIASTEKIAMALYGKTVLNFAICREMAKLNNQTKLESMGFSSIAEYGKALFDFSRITSQQYARIGEIFINDDYKIKYDNIPQNLQKGHLIELLAYVGEDGDVSAIEDLYIDGILTDSMSTTKMRQVLKDWKNGTLAIETSASEIPEIEEKSSKKDKKSGDVSQLTESSTPSETGAEELGFDIQREVGKILSACNEISNVFGTITQNGYTPAGYQGLIDQVRDIAYMLLA